MPQWKCITCGDEYSYELIAPAGAIDETGEPYCISCLAIDNVIVCSACNTGQINRYGIFSRRRDSRPVCNACLENKFFRCHVCGSACENEELNPTSDGFTLCRECYGNHTVACYECSSKVVEYTDYSGSRYCYECMRSVIEEKISSFNDDDCECGDCQEIAMDLINAAINCNYNDIINVEWECSECGEIHVGRYVPQGRSNIERLLWVGDPASMDGDVLCNRCFQQHEERTKYKIFSYSYKPPPDFRRVTRDLDERSLYFGTEVEIEVDDDSNLDDALKMIAEKDLDTLFYCKSDSCIRNGFELVSHPFTFDWMSENPDSFGAMFSLGTIMKGWESTNCGMHVHMSMDAFSNLQLLKFMRFFYRNKGFITKLARRPKGKLEEWATMRSPDDATLQKFTRRKRGSIGVGRAALSVENRHTIECRIFRSTLAPTAYYGNIEFLQALFDYTKTCGLHQLEEDRFMSFVHDRSKGYPNFIALTSTLRPVVIDDK